MVIFKPGDIIIESYPLVHTVSSKQKAERCDYCFKNSTSLKKCSACKLLRYCSIGCQSQDWSVHKIECKMPQNDPSDNDILEISDIRLAHRLIILWAKFPEILEQPIETFNGKISFRQIIDKFSKEVELIASRVEFQPLYQTASPMVLRYFEKMGISLDHFTIAKLYFISIGNRCDIRDEFLAPIGSGIYVAASYYGFSCDPNCCQVFDGPKMQLRAIREFNTDEQPPLIAHIDSQLLSPPSSFRNFKRNDLVCGCKRCSSSQKNQQLENLLDLSRKFELCTMDRGFRGDYGPARRAAMRPALKKAYNALEKLLCCEKRYFDWPNPYRSVLLSRRVMLDIMLDDHHNTSVHSVELRNNLLITHGQENSLYKGIKKNIESNSSVMSFSQFGAVGFHGDESR
ncbi:uncharacterized protein LOC141858385 [Brevipalpus obovatus]|uniref:uncharacterized protein LOC141858385 n=1 Tax=Brevipalpus obovatus TaxID=246614 RepID=UPI003D9F755F